MLSALTLALLAPTATDTIRAQAASVRPLVTSAVATDWLSQTAALSEPTPRKLFRHKKRGTWLSEIDQQKLIPSLAMDYREVPVTGELYYNTKYGSPIAYSRAVDLLGRAGLSTLKGKRLFDFGYGGIGHLRLAALAGAQATGIDVDPFLTTLYSHNSDQGRYGRGSVRVLTGYFPSDAKVVKEVGGGYDVFLSKNTLKRGYIHPERPVDKRQLIDLGVSDEGFLAAVKRMLKPGGYFLIYNLSPAQNPVDKPYIPWADGRSPFSKEQFEKSGFEVLSFDVDDNEAAHQMAHALGWDQGARPMDLKKDLFAHYTLVRRKR
jgi:hypothetical protein